MFLPQPKAPWDKLSTKDMELRSKSEMLLESMFKCRIWIPLEILSFLDPKISKIGQEMEKLAQQCLVLPRAQRLLKRLHVAI